MVHAGAVVTPLNPLYKERELLHQLADSGASGIFALGLFQEPVGHVRAQLPPLRHNWAIEDVWGMAQEAPPEPLAVAVDPPEDLACLPYSSGTTGLPKGVMISHFNLIANLRQLLATGLVTPHSVFLDFLPFFHAYGLTVLMNGGFVTGATQVLDAAVIPKPDPRAGEVPKAFVVPRPGDRPDPDGILHFVAQRVAPFKKVREIEFVETIPKSLSGKILRRELIEREQARVPE